MHLYNRGHLLLAPDSRGRSDQHPVPSGASAVCVPERAGVSGSLCPLGDDARRNRDCKGNRERSAQRRQPRGAVVHPSAVHSIVGNTTSAKGWGVLVRTRGRTGTQAGRSRTRRQVECHLWICGRCWRRRAKGHNLCRSPLVPLHSRTTLYAVSPRTPRAVQASHRWHPLQASPSSSFLACLDAMCRDSSAPSFALNPHAIHLHLC